MKEGNRLKAQERLNDSNAYKAMEQVQKLMDTYYLDGVIGLLEIEKGRQAENDGVHYVLTEMLGYEPLIEHNEDVSHRRQ